ncbi:MAG TPA: hypothetical protein VIF15_10540 [Polyangiaceae bacterium]|jgi:hypothetical protein
MRIPLALAAAALPLGCSVPDVTFTADDATAETGGPEAGDDASEGGAGDGTSGTADADADAPPGPYDGPVYCADGGPPPPDGGKCCPGGAPCYGTCNAVACGNCGSCSSPSVCCSKGSAGTCGPPPCL